MKHFFPFLAFLCASSHNTATAAPPAPARRASGRPLPITGFVAQGYPQAMDGDQHLSFVEYNVTLSPGEESTWCWAWAQVPDLSIGDIPAAVCQADHTVDWSFVKMSDADYNFTVSWQFTGHGRLVGSCTIPGSQVRWVTEGSQAVQHYVGPASFNVSAEDVFGT